MTERTDSLRRVTFALAKGAMAGVAWGEESRAPDIVFLHATGLNALAYRTLLAPLAERFHVLALDLRGHGRTALPARTFGYTSWTVHRNDVIELIDKHIRARVTLAGHSMGATTALLVAGKRPDLVRGLALIEPVILPPARIEGFQLPLAPLFARWTSPIARGAARRRARFVSREAAFAALKGRGFFNAFPDAALQDYLTDGLVDEDESVRLACSPKYEAATFSAHRHDPWRALPRAPKALVLVRAEKESTCPAPIAARVKAMRPDARIAMIEGASHALPMERPDRARAAIETAHLMATGGAFIDPE